MNIVESIVYGLEKSANSVAVTKIPRQEPLKIDQRLNTLAKDTLDIYGDVCNNYGTFSEDIESYRFPTYLKEYIDGNIDLVRFSHSTSNLISIKMGESLPATGGYVLFLRYENQGRDWLLIVMLKLKPQTGINQRTLDLIETLVLDINHLHEAARIDLEKWKKNEQPYLSFVKKRGSQDEVTRYFRFALGCTEYMDSKHNTLQTMKAVDHFCNDKNMTPEQKQNIRRITYDYCDLKRQSQEPVNLTALSAQIQDQDPNAFLEFVKDKEYTISEFFSPHRNSYNRFKRISSRIGSVKVSFDVDDIFNQTVIYVPETNSLFIKNIPRELIEEIQKVEGKNNDLDT